jgi:hypothetical protein
MSEPIPTVGQRGDEVQPRHPESVVGHHLQPGLARLVSSLLQQVAPWINWTRAQLFSPTRLPT